MVETLTGVERIKKGYLRLGNNNNIDRQGILGLPPVYFFFGFALSVAVYGLAYQEGIVDQIQNFICKSQAISYCTRN